MNRLKLIKFFEISIVVFGLIVFMAIFSKCKQGNLKKQKPNILLILTDDLGYGDISCYGQKNYQTPNIDKLATNGVRCTDFYVPTPYCAPSRATLLTGRFPLKHGLIKNPTPDAGINDIGIQSEETTLAEIFQTEGYQTKCIGKWHLGHKEEYFPVNHGFDEYYGILYSNDMRPVQIIENLDTVQYPVDQNLLTKDYTEKAIEFIERNKDERFFLHLCHAMPHKPLAASDRFYTPDTPNDLYTDVIKELDWSIGEIMESLKRNKLLDNTIVIFMSDNGPWFGGSAGEFKGMKATSWEGGVRVPFIIHYQKIFPLGKKINTACWSPDILPTLLALADVTQPENINIDGQDITEILKGNQKEHAPIFTMHNNRIMTVRKGNWKLFVHNPGYFKKERWLNWVDSRGPDGTTILAPFEQATPEDYPGIIPVETENEIQLYNLRNDPGEETDLSGSNPDKVNELMNEYKVFEQSMTEI